MSELGRTLGEELLRPTHIYVRSIQCLRQHGVEVKAISHITGGGLYENVPRMMKAGLTARIQKDSFPVPPIFEIIQRSGDIPERDMYNTFNMGIGLVIAIPKDQIGHAWTCWPGLASSPPSSAPWSRATPAWSWSEDGHHGTNCGSGLRRGHQPPGAD